MIIHFMPENKKTARRIFGADRTSFCITYEQIYFHIYSVISDVRWLLIAADSDSSGTSVSRERDSTISRRTSGVICAWVWVRNTASRASFCSEVISSLYLQVQIRYQITLKNPGAIMHVSLSRWCPYRWTNTRRHWCQRTGMVLWSETNRWKWKTSASTTRYGNAYFLTSITRKNIEFAPVYGSSAICNIAADVCSTYSQQCDIE